MAKIVSDHVVVTVSKIARDNESDEQSLIPAELRETVEQVVSELLVGTGLVVEVK